MTTKQIEPWQRGGILGADFGSPEQIARSEAYRRERYAALEAEAAKAKAEAERIVQEEQTIEIMTDALMSLPGVREYIERSRTETKMLSKESVRLYRADFQAFRTWCEAEKVRPLPADGGVVATYIIERAQAGFKTVRRALAAIAAVHKVAELPDPTQDTRVLAARAFLDGLVKKFKKPRKGKRANKPTAAGTPDATTTETATP